MSEKEENFTTDPDENITNSSASDKSEKEPVLVGANSAESCPTCNSIDCPHQNTDITPLLPGNSEQPNKPEAKGIDSQAPEAIDTTDDTETVLVNISKSGAHSKIEGKALKRPQSWELRPGLKELFEKSQEDLVGHTLANKYALLSLIGKGGMSAVYSAKDLKLNKILALKLLLPHLASKQLNAKRFQIEAQAASSLYHPNLIAMHDYGVTDDGIPYIAMDLLEGKSLSEVLTESSYLEPKRAVPIFIQICDALAHAHGKNVLHRDLKPSNVMITTTDSKFEFVKLVDFGIAKMLPENDEESLNITKTGEIFGSPQYMSPEQCSSQPMDARSDIYSMGCLMYEVLSGKPPFHNENMMETLFAQMNDSPPDFKSINSELDIPQQLQLIVFKCLAKSPEDRYQSASELADQLNRFNQTATDIFIRQVQAKWQVFKLKSRPLRKREKKFLAVALLVSVLLVVAAFKMISTYFSDDSALARISTSQYFLPEVPAKEEIPLDKIMLTRAMEAGLVKRLDKLDKDTPSSEILNLIEATEIVAKNCEKLKQYDLARKYHLVTVELYKKFGDKDTVHAYSITLPKLSVGKCYFAEGRYKKAIPYFSKYAYSMTKFADNPRDRFELVKVLALKAASEYSTGDFHASIRDYKKIFRLVPNTDRRLSNAQMALLYSQYGDAQRILHSYKSATKAFESAESYYKAMPNLGTTHNTTNLNRFTLTKYLKAYCYFKLKRYKIAKPLYEDTIPKLKALPNIYQNVRVAALAQYAKVLWNLNDYQKSIETNMKAKELKEKIDL